MAPLPTQDMLPRKTSHMHEFCVCLRAPALSGVCVSAHTQQQQNERTSDSSQRQPQASTSLYMHAHNPHTCKHRLAHQKHIHIKGGHVCVCVLQLCVFVAMVTARKCLSLSNGLRESRGSLLEAGGLLYLDLSRPVPVDR